MARQHRSIDDDDVAAVAEPVPLAHHGPIRFEENLKVTIQELGWWPNGEFHPLTDDIASVGYWCPSEPHGTFPVMLGVRERFSR